MKKTILFIYLLSQLVSINSYSQKWKTMTSRGDKIAYNSSNIYQNPVFFVFIRKGTRTPIPTITIASKRARSFGTHHLYCDFDNGQLSIKRTLDVDSDVLPYLKVTGTGYNFYKLNGDIGPIISNLKKGKTVKFSIERDPYKSIKTIITNKNISLRGSTAAINYCLGIKTNPSPTNNISGEYYWVVLSNSENSRKVHESQFVSFFINNYSYINKIQASDNSKTGKYNLYYNDKVLDIPNSKVLEINYKLRELGLNGRDALVKIDQSENQGNQPKPSSKRSTIVSPNTESKPSINLPTKPKSRPLNQALKPSPKVNNDFSDQTLFLILIIIFLVFIWYTNRIKNNDGGSSSEENESSKKQNPVVEEIPGVDREIDLNSIQWNANGSGLILSKDGYIVTNSHVVTSKEKTVKNIGVEFNYKDEIKTFNAKVVKNDFINDLAIIKIDDKNFKGLTEVIPFSVKKEEAELGEEVFALGYPLALNLMGTDIKFTDGRISSKTGFKGNISTYQSTAPIQPGSSGGPLFDFNGNLLGINSSGLSKEIADNVSYTIKTSYLKTLLNVLPKKIKLPTKNTLEGLSDTEKIKILTKYVALIKIELV